MIGRACHHALNSRVQTGAIATARQNANAFYCHQNSLSCNNFSKQGYHIQ
jgi:hypothetical protein